MILSFGTINVDLVTRVARFPVPGETVKGRDYLICPGGKGANQALSAARAGAGVMLAGSVGQDAFSEAALVNLVAAGVDIRLVHRSSLPTGLYMIAIDPSGENLMIGANAANNDARADHLAAALAGGNVTLLTQNSLGVAEVETAIVMARAAGCRIVYNAAPAEPVSANVFSAANVVIVNEHEARTYAERLGFRVEPRAFAADVFRNFAVSLIVTLGSRGLVGCIAGQVVTAAAPAIAAIDTTGAGDAFCGAVAAGLDRGAPLARAVLEGLAAGSLACLQVGAQSSFADAAAIAALADTLHLQAD